MTFSRRSFPHILSAALVAGVALAPAGCGGDGVNSYTVPKTTEPSRSAPGGDPHAGAGGPVAGAGNYRILGAMYPAGQPGWFWFFKFAGPADQIGAQEANFDALAKSVKFGGDPRAVPTFTIPTGWERAGPRDLGVVRFDEVLKVNGLECTVSMAGGGAEGNLSRWAGQVGASPANATTEFDANGVKALRVDLRGPKNPVGGMGKGGPKLPAGHP